MSHNQYKIRKFKCKYCNKIIVKRVSLFHTKYCSKSCSRKDHPSYMLGKYHTEETKQKMSVVQKGRKFSKESKEKMSRNRIGMKFSEEHIKNLRLAHLGQFAWNKGFKNFSISREKNPNWKGGITPLSKQVRMLLEYKQWVKSIFKRDNYTCQICYKKGNYLHADHIKQFATIFQEFLQQYSQFSPIEDKETLIRLAITYQPFWDIDNGRTLCKECHQKTDSYAYYERKK